MRLRLPRLVIVVTGAAVRPRISPTGVASTIVSLASFEVFAVRRATLVAELFEGVSGGAQSVGCGPQRVDEAALSPTVPHRYPPEEIDRLLKFRL
jgi:hypothetical protein